jgi:hypothetical protein
VSGGVVSGGVVSGGVVSGGVVSGGVVVVGVSGGSVCAAATLTKTPTESVTVTPTVSAAARTRAALRGYDRTRTIHPAHCPCHCGNHATPRTPENREPENGRAWRRCDGDFPRVGWCANCRCGALRDVETDARLG